MMVSSHLTRPLALAASSVGLFQAFIWLTSSILCICCYFGIILPDVPWKIAKGEGDHNEIYWIFLADSGCEIGPGLFINPTVFFIFMWFYAVLSLIWCLISGIMLHEMLHFKWSNTQYIFGGWSLTTAIISLIDVTFMALLIHDSSRTELSSYKIMIALAIRGGFLWILNVLFIIVMVKFTVDIKKEIEKGPPMEFIDAYAAPEVWQNNILNNIWSVTESNAPPIYANLHFESASSFSYEATNYGAAPQISARPSMLSEIEPRTSESESIYSSTLTNPSIRSMSNSEEYY